MIIIIYVGFCHVLQDSAAPIGVLHCKCRASSSFSPESLFIVCQRFFLSPQSPAKEFEKSFFFLLDVYMWRRREIERTTSWNFHSAALLMHTRGFLFIDSRSF